MNTNVVICRNEVFVEDVSVGQFESFECQADSRTLGQTGVLTLPLYAVGADKQTGSARSRIRKVFVQGQDKALTSLIRPCAEVRVYCWYTNTFWAKEGEKTVLRNVDAEKTLVFSGFIEHIAEGFPTKIYLQDNSFMLRFGSISKWWDGSNTLQSIITDVLPIAQTAFDNERKRLGFTREIPRITYSTEKKNVQAVTTPMSFREFGGGSPFDVIQRLMTLLVLYGGVSREFNVYVGAGVTESTRPIIELDTRYNVIERDIVPLDGRFIDYDVKVTGILKNGKRYTATGGEATSRSGEKKSQFEQSYGESFRGFSILNTQSGIQKMADNLLANLKGFRNKGKITLLLYPKVEVMDWLTYTDTVFEELSSGYYVLGYSFKADDRGYFQNIEVTDKVFAI